MLHVTSCSGYPVPAIKHVCAVFGSLFLPFFNPFSCRIEFACLTVNFDIFVPDGQHIVFFSLCFFFGGSRCALGWVPGCLFAKNMAGAFVKTPHPLCNRPGWGWKCIGKHCERTGEISCAFSGLFSIAFPKKVHCETRERESGMHILL